MTITDFLVWLAGGGCVIAASWILGKFVWYNKLVDNIKQLIFFLVAVIFGGGAYAVTQYVSAATLAAIAPYFLIVVSVFSYVFLNKLYTRLTKIDSDLTSFLKSQKK